MDILLLSRLQFAMTTFVHFIFVPLTLGLSLLVAYMESKYVRTGEEIYKRMTKFWGKLFLINFALGVVTGIALEFQFGTNWANYSSYVGDIFGSLLAIEATLAFFLESTFLGIWIFGWQRLSPKMHNASIWLVGLASNLSAFWIIMANGWMQNPVGYLLADGRAELASFGALVTNGFAWNQFIHILAASYVLSGMFVMGISAYHLARGNNVDLFNRSFRIAAPFTLIFALVLVVHGHSHGANVAKHQPAKLAAMESHWETMPRAPQYLVVVPDPIRDGNRLELLPIPAGLSLLTYHSPNAVVQGLKDFAPEDRPPVWLTFISFRTMVGFGMALLLLSAWAWKNRHDPQRSATMLKLLPWMIPVPYLAIQFGWLVAEVGRQPWIVYGVMRTADAVSPGISVSQVVGSLAGFIAIYAMLVALHIFLLGKYSRLGPEAPPRVKV